MSFSTAARTMALVFYTPFVLTIAVALAALDLAIATSQELFEVPELVTARYTIIAGFCVVGASWGIWARWTVLRRTDRSDSLSFYRRSASALTAGILVGGLVIATTSSSVAFLTGFLTGLCTSSGSGQVCN